MDYFRAVMTYFLRVRAVTGVALALTALASAVMAQSWTLSGPSARFSHSAVFDPTSAQMIIFGGQSNGTNLNDLWLGVTSSAQNVTFTAMTATGTAPSAR